jgi:competence protein ComGC
MERSGFTKEFLVVILVLGVFTIVMLSTTSYAYKDNSDDYYLQVINVIEKQAVLYGDTLDNLKNEGNFVITVEDLVSNGYYMADDAEGNVVDPRNSKHNLNGLKIKLTYEKGKVKANVIEEE